MSVELISRTLAEIAATGMKAARGSGCAWGLAEEAGMAARIVESCWLPGVSALAHLLQSERNCDCAKKRGSARCGIAALASLSDRIAELSGGAVIEVDQVAGPLLLAAPLHLAARRTGAAYSLCWEGADVCVHSGGIGLRNAPDDWNQLGQSVCVSVDPLPGPVPALKTEGSMIPAADWYVLEGLAAMTFVPESEDSRAKGAGPDG